MFKIVYGLLYPHSDTSFVKELVLQNMGLSGEDVIIEMNTMTGRTISKSQVVQGLVVEEATGVELTLPPTYSKGDIPAER